MNLTDTNIDKTETINIAARIIFNEIQKGHVPFETTIKTYIETVNILSEYNPAKPDHEVLSLLTYIETQFKLSSRWTQNGLVIGSSIVAYEDGNVSDMLKARFWGTLIHLAKFKDIFGV